MSETEAKAQKLWTALQAAAFAVASAESGFFSHVSMYGVSVEVVEAFSAVSGGTQESRLCASIAKVEVLVRAEVSGVNVYVSGHRAPTAADFEAEAQKAAKDSAWLGKMS